MPVEYAYRLDLRRWFVPCQLSQTRASKAKNKALRMGQKKAPALAPQADF
jgi:hypothetical protein